MKPQKFIENWKAVELKERSASQSHFNDLCRLLDIEQPTTADPKGEWFTFEKGASKTSGGEGWADVWRKDCFAWEYKGKRKNLDAAFDQLLRYSVALDHPPLLIVSDMDQILIHTNWTNTVQKVYTITLDDLLDAGKRDILRNAFLEPERLKPAKTRQVLTEDAAKKFSRIAQRLRDRGHDGHVVAHFVNRLVFCMFAEDVSLLPNKMFQRVLEHSQSAPEEFQENAEMLFAAMASKDIGKVGLEKVEWFNGGLFDDNSALSLERADVVDLLDAARLDWSDIDPSILGTLFERGLDPSKRSQLGAHYTDRDKIVQIVEPVIVSPLLAEWAEIKAKIEHLLENAPKETADKLLRGKELAARTRALNAAEVLQAGFLERLRAFRVLDPACGSGNFLYLSLLSLKDLEHRINLEAEALGLPPAFPTIGPESVKGIEINPYAAELARVSVWIGEIQWMRRNGYEASKNPILRPLGTIECRDAVLNPDGTKAEWPNVDVVVGNPPFIGSQKMIRELGEDYTNRVRYAWREEVPASCDFVALWFAKAFSEIQFGRVSLAGFVATNSIRELANRTVMKKIANEGRIFCALSDEPWVVDGADVRVSMVCFEAGTSKKDAVLDGRTVGKILANLTSNDHGFDLTQIKKQGENRGFCARGIELGGPFELDRDTFERFCAMPTNPNGVRNEKVMERIISADGLSGRGEDTFILDFSAAPEKHEAALFEGPYSELEKRYETYGSTSKRKVVVRDDWWLHRRSGSALRAALVNRNRFLVTPRVAKHRYFAWVQSPTLPDSRLFAFGTSSDVHFGVLSSEIHEAWSLAACSWHGVGNDPTYNGTSVFETFPFPDGLTPDVSPDDYDDNPRTQTIAAAAARLNELRENWLNPVDLINRVAEVVPGFPDRILPKDDEAAKELKKRTLTNLYNARPAWLDHVQRVLDEAVAEAYGWGDDWRAGVLTDDEILARLFRLNQARAAK